MCVRFHRKKARSGSEKAGGGAVVHLARNRAQSHPERARPGLGAARGSGLRQRAPKPDGHDSFGPRPAQGPFGANAGASFVPTAPPPQPRPCLRGRSLFTPGRAAAPAPSPRRGGVGGGAPAPSPGPRRARRPPPAADAAGPRGPPYSRPPTAPRPGPQRPSARPRSARARVSGGPGAARDALRPLAPRPPARHPRRRPRAACPLFWSHGPAAPPLTASELGARQSACAPAQGPPRAPPRAPRPEHRPLPIGRAGRGARVAARAARPLAGPASWASEPASEGRGARGRGGAGRGGAGRGGAAGAGRGRRGDRKSTRLNSSHQI